jgi:hypothetical protein
MSTFHERLYIEREELDEKILKLKNFIQSENISKVSKIQKSLLRSQVNVMIAYSEILAERIENIME